MQFLWTFPKLHWVENTPRSRRIFQKPSTLGGQVLQIASKKSGKKAAWDREECTWLEYYYCSPTNSHLLVLRCLGLELRGVRGCTALKIATTCGYYPANIGIPYIFPFHARDESMTVFSFSPKLTWRDMQHLTVLTSKRNSLFDSKGRFHWNMNGVGLEFNHLFGFGVLDAGAMVALAKQWKSVPARYHCEAGSDNKVR